MAAGNRQRGQSRPVSPVEIGGSRYVLLRPEVNMAPVETSNDTQYRWMTVEGPDGEPCLGLVPEDE